MRPAAKGCAARADSQEAPAVGGERRPTAGRSALHIGSGHFAPENYTTRGIRKLRCLPFRESDRFPETRRAVACTFFVLFFLHVALVLNPRLLYLADGVLVGATMDDMIDFPAWYRGSEYLGEVAFRPGGWIEYAASFASQAFAHRLLGALVLTGVAWAAWFLTGSVLKA